jgi:predicted RNase H-related nuclease YkuK (DUF458 family)
MWKSKFKRFGGDHIEDIVEYLKNFIEKDPTVTISVGCDSIQKRRRTLYAITIMLYNTDIGRGAHVIFFRESCPKIRETQSRLYKEAQYLHDLATYLDTELQSFYKRKDLTEIERKRYKYHLLKCNGEFLHVPSHQDFAVMKSLSLTSADNVEYKLVDIHVDFNPSEGTINENGMHKNKSYAAYKSYAPWLRGLGFRTWAKPIAWASTSAADLLLQD